MGERMWRRAIDFGMSDAEVLREILLDGNGEPRDGVEQLRRGWEVDAPKVYVIPAEMLEADDG